MCTLTQENKKPIAVAVEAQVLRWTGAPSNPTAWQTEYRLCVSELSLTRSVRVLNDQTRKMTRKKEERNT